MALVCDVVRAGSCKVKLARVAANLILIAGLISAKSVFAQNTNILTNPGFETGSLSGWTAFGNTIGNVSVQSSASQAHSGTYYFKTYGRFNGATNYSAIYQDNISAPSNAYSADGWAFPFGSDGDGIHGQDAIWLEISLRDTSDNALALDRSAIVTSHYPGQLRRDECLVRFADHTNQCHYTNASARILLPGTVKQQPTINAICVINNSIKTRK